MSDTKHTLPAELEFDTENHGNSNKPGYGILTDGRSSRINIEGCDDDAVALSQEVVRRWNCHDDLVAALKVMLDSVIDKGAQADPDFYMYKPIEQARAALAKAGEK